MMTGLKLQVSSLKMRNSRKLQVSSLKVATLWWQEELRVLTVCLLQLFLEKKLLSLKSHPCDLQLVTCDYARGVLCS